MIRVPEGNERSLAEVRADELVRVERIRYGILRDLCSNIGLHEGDRIRCRHVSRSGVILDSESGQRLVVDGDWARLITVR